MLFVFGAMQITACNNYCVVLKKAEYFMITKGLKIGWLISAKNKNDAHISKRD